MSQNLNIKMPFLTKSVFECVLPFAFTKTSTAAIFVPFIRNYAARKGYRDQKLKGKQKSDVKKSKFEIVKKESLPQKGSTRKFDDSWKILPTDDVYPQKYYKWKVYSFEEAVLAHRETHHPQMYNQPNAYLHVTVELNMSGEKKNKFLDNFNRVVAIPHKFEHGEERSIIAFTKTPEMVAELKNAGASCAGGVDLIKQVQNGGINLQDFQFIVAHPNILPELTVLKGLMRKRFPNVRAGNLEADLINAVLRYYHGINYVGLKDEYEKDFGTINTRIGTLNMEPGHLEENFSVFINDVQQHKPKRAGSFITRTILWSPPSCEKFKVDHNLYIKTIEESTKEQQDEEEEILDINENERAVAV